MAARTLAAKKLVIEAAAVLKDTAKGVAEWEATLLKHDAAEDRREREKLAAALKGDLRRLQLKRERLMEWLSEGSAENVVLRSQLGNLDQVSHARKAVEACMWKHTCLIRESKVKQFSTRNLKRQGNDPHARERAECAKWLHDVVARLEATAEGLEADAEALPEDEEDAAASKKKKGKAGKEKGSGKASPPAAPAPPSRAAQLRTLANRHRWHIERIGAVLWALEDGRLSPVEVREQLEEGLDYFVSDAAADPDFCEDEGLYDGLALDGDAGGGGFAAAAGASAGASAAKKEEVKAAVEEARAAIEAEARTAREARAAAAAKAKARDAAKPRPKPAEPATPTAAAGAAAAAAAGASWDAAAAAAAAAVAAGSGDRSPDDSYGDLFSGSGPGSAGSAGGAAAAAKALGGGDVWDPAADAVAAPPPRTAAASMPGFMGVGAAVPPPFATSRLPAPEAAALPPAFDAVAPQLTFGGVPGDGAAGLLGMLGSPAFGAVPPPPAFAAMPLPLPPPAYFAPPPSAPAPGGGDDLDDLMRIMGLGH